MAIFFGGIYILRFRNGRDFSPDRSTGLCHDMNTETFCAVLAYGETALLPSRQCHPGLKYWYLHIICAKNETFLLQFLLWFQVGHKTTSKVKYLGVITHLLSRGKLVNSFNIKGSDTKKRECKLCAFSPFTSLYCMTTWNLRSRAITGFFQHRGRADWSLLPHLQLVVLVEHQEWNFIQKQWFRSGKANRVAITFTGLSCKSGMAVPSPPPITARKMSGRVWSYIPAPSVEIWAFKAAGIRPF